MKAPNKNYEKFFEKFDEINTLNIKEWNKNHLIGYFCKKYKEYYNIDFTFKFNTTAPSKCFEVFHMNKLMLHLTKEPEILKDYIDWVFARVVPKCKKRFTSISFLTKEVNVNYYKLNILINKQKSIIDRNTILPDKYKLVFNKTSEMNINTYGELSFLYKMTNKDDNLTEAFNLLTNNGFDLEILNKIL